MNKRLMIAIFSLSLIVSMVSSEALGFTWQPPAPEDNDITDLYYNILIGELFPSGNVYLERFSLSGGFDNLQNFEGLNYSEEIAIYPIKKAKWASVRASFSRLIKATEDNGYTDDGGFNQQL
jgi:hypothetical protein